MAKKKNYISKSQYMSNNRSMSVNDYRNYLNNKQETKNQYARNAVKSVKSIFDYLNEWKTEREKYQRDPMGWLAENDPEAEREALIKGYKTMGQQKRAWRDQQEAYRKDPMGWLAENDPEAEREALIKGYKTMGQQKRANRDLQEAYRRDPMGWLYDNDRDAYNDALIKGYKTMGAAKRVARDEQERYNRDPLGWLEDNDPDELKKWMIDNYKYMGQQRRAWRDKQAELNAQATDPNKWTTPTTKKATTIDELLGKKDQKTGVEAPRVSNEQLKQNYLDSMQKKFNDKYADLNRALKVQYGDADLGSLMGGQTAEMKDLFQTGNARKYQDTIEELRSGGYFNNGDDMSLWTPEKRRSKKQVYLYNAQRQQNEIDRLQRAINAQDQTGNRWDPLMDLYSTPEVENERAIINGEGYTEEEKQKAREQLNWLMNKTAGIGSQSATDRAQNFYRYNEQNLTALKDHMNMDSMRRMAYDAMNGNGAYDRIMNGTDQQAKDKVNELIDNALALVEDPNGQLGIDLRTAQAQLEITNDKIKELDAWEEKEKKLNSLINGAEIGDTAFHPENVSKYGPDAPAYLQENVTGISNLINGNNVDAVYASLDPERYNNDDIRSLPNNRALMMRKKERDIFLSYYNAGKKSEAWAFYQALEPYLNQRYSKIEDLSFRETARRMPVLSSVGTLFAHVAQPVEALINLPGQLDALINGTENAQTDPYSHAYITTRVKTGIRNAVTQDLGDWGWVYSGFMSGADSWLNVALAKGMGLEGKMINLLGTEIPAAQAATLALFHTQAFETSLQNTMTQGNDPYGYDFIEAWIDAAIETATEIWSVENWMSDPTNLLRYVAKIAISEPSEEIVGAVIEPYVKKLMGHKHQYEERAKEILANGGYEDGQGKFVKVTDMDTATRQAMREWNHDIRMAAQEALLSVGPSIVYGGAQIALGTNNMGRAISSNNLNGENDATRAIAEAAAGMTPGTASQKQGQKVLEKLKAGKQVSNYRLGQLQNSISLDAAEQVQSAQQDERLKLIQQDMEARGAEATQAEELAEIVEKAIEKGGLDKLSVKERRAINGNQAALNTYFNFRTYNQTQANNMKAQQQVAAETEKAAKNALGAMSVAENLITNRITNDNLQAGRHMATEQDVRAAEGEAVKGPRGIILNTDNGAQNAKLIGLIKEDNEIKYRVEVNGESLTVDRDQVVTSNPATAAVLEAQENNPHLYSQRYTNKMLQELEIGKVQNKPAAFMRDAMLIRLSAFTDRAMPQTELPQSVAERLYNDALNEHQQNRANQTKETQRNAMKPGQGFAVYKGVKSSSKAFDNLIEKNKSLSEADKKLMRTVANLAQAAGVQVDFVDNADIASSTDKELAPFKGQEYKLYGSESKQGITINIEGRNNDQTRHHIGITFGHEFTHWLQRNSGQGYDAIAQYILEEQRKQRGTRGLNSELNRIMNEQGLDLEDAISELVADSCDTIFSSEEVVKHIQQTNKGLYQQIRSFVKDLLQKMRSAMANMAGSQSRQSREVELNMQKLAKLYNIAWDEAWGGLKENNYQNLTEEETKQVKTRLSQADTVLDKDGLVATHSISLNDMQKLMKLEGIPAASIAVSQTNGELSSGFFGEISFIFDKNTIDPMANQDNYVFGRDAWTPTFPHTKKGLFGERFIENNKKVTAQNAVDIMRNGRNLKSGVYGENFSDTEAPDINNNYQLLHHIASEFSKNYISVEAIQADRQRLGTMSAEQIRNEISTHEQDMDILKRQIISEIEQSGRNIEAIYGDRQRGEALDVLTAFRQVNSGSQEGIRQLGLSEQTVKDIRKMISEMQNIPVRYAEAKPMRVINWDEIKLATIPKQTPMEIVNFFDKNGINYEIYDGLENRAEIMENSENVRRLRFSFADMQKLGWEEQVDHMLSDNAKTDDVMELAKAEELKGIGIDVPMSLRHSVLTKMMRDPGETSRSGHKLTEQEVKKIKNDIIHPAAKIVRGNTVYLITNNLDENNKPIVFIGEMTNKISKNGTLDATTILRRNYVSTLFGKFVDNQFVPYDDAKIWTYKENANDILSLSPGQFRAGTDVISAIERLTQNNEESKSRKSQAELDNQYMQAVKDGNTEQQQELVDQAAEKNGYTMKVYHGTPYGGFTQFKDWSYFTENKDYADRYNHSSASSIRGYYSDNQNPMTYELRMNPGRVFDTRDADAAEVYNQYRMEYGLGELQENGLPDWTDGRDIIEFIEENDLPYDTIVLDEGADGGYGQEVVKRGVSYVTRSNMVKSAAPVTYDDQGNVIPPSERFNEEKKDIRWSQAEEDQQETELRNTWQNARDEVDELREKHRAMKPKADAWVDRILQAEKDGRMDEEMAAYKEWESGYTKLRDELYNAEQRYKEANKAFDDYIEARDVAAEQQQIAKSKLSEPDYRRRQAVNQFGYTVDFREAGYLMPDGKMLNFSGEKGRHYGSRGEDHRGIGVIYASSQKQGGAAMMAFMNDGNIRVMAETPGVDMISTIEPTAEQYEQIRRMAQRFRSEEYFNVDFTDENGYTVDSIEYDGRVDPNRIVNDIKSFYKTGEVPQQSVVSQFHYSQMTEEAMDVQSWIMNQTPSSLQTEDERQMVQAFKDMRIKMSLSLKRISDYQAKIRQLESKQDQLTPAEKDELTAARNRLEIQQGKLAQLEDELYQVTSSEGYAGMMYRQNMVLKDFVAGKTQDQVRQTVEDMLKKVQRTQEEIRKDTASLRKLADAQAVKTMESYLGKSSLSKMASLLRKNYNSTMSKGEVQSRLAEMALKLAQGEDITGDSEVMARDLIDKMRGERSENLDYIKGTTLVIGQDLLRELKAENLTMKDLRAQLKGSGVTLKTGDRSTFRETWQELRGDEERPEQGNKALVNLNEENSESGALHAVLDYIENEVRSSSGSQQGGYDLDEMALVVRSMAGNVTTYLVNDPTARKQINSLMQQISELRNKTDRTAADMEALDKQLDEVVLAGQKAKGWTTVLQRDVNDAIKYYNKMAEVAAKEEKMKVRKQLIEQLRSENTRKLIEQQEQFNERMKKDKKTRELMQDNMVLRRRITTVTKRMANLLGQETDLKNIPEKAKPLARQAIRMVVQHDLVNRMATLGSREGLEGVKQILDILDARDGTFSDRDLDWLVRGEGENADWEIHDQVVQALIDVESGLMAYRNAEGRGTTSLMDRKEALNKVSEAMAKIWSVIRSSQMAEINGRKMYVDELAMEMAADMAGSRFKGEWTGRIGKKIGSGKSFVVYGNMTPEYFIKNLKNGTMTYLYDEYHRAENRAGLYYAQAQQRLEQIAKETGYNTWDLDRKYTIQLDKGGTVTLNLEQMMQLYATWYREKTLQDETKSMEKTFHLTQGGFYVENDEKHKVAGRELFKQRAYRMNEVDIGKLSEQLTDAQKQYVNQVVDYLSKDMSALGNEASMKMYGIKKYNETYYFPFEIWSGVKAVKSDAGAGGSMESHRGAHPSFSNRLKNNAGNALMIRGFTQTAAKHIVQMINYNTFAPAIENLQRVMNTQLATGEGDNLTQRNLWAAFGENYGKDALQYMKDFQEAVNGGVNRENRTPYDKLLSTFRKSAVAGSLSVALQQPLSYIRAAMEISPKYLAEAWNPASVAKTKASIKEMEQYSGVAVLKKMGKFDMGFGQSAQQFITPEAKQNTKQIAYEKASEATTFLPEMMDKLTWARIWEAVKQEQKAQNKEADVKSPEFLQQVAERFNEVLRLTQVYDSVLVRSRNMRSTNPIMKGLTSFMAEPTLSLNVLADAVINAKEKGGMTKVAKAGATFVMSAVAQALVKGLMGAGRNPDKDKTWDENVAYRFMYNFMNEINPISMIPGYSDLITILKNGELSDDAMSTLGKLADAVQMGFSVLTGEQKDIYRGIEDSIGIMTQLFTNVPLKNVMRDARAIVNFFTQPYAQRANSAGVLKYQLFDQAMTADNFLGALNKRLGYKIYNTTNSAYYQRIYDARKEGREQDEQDMTDYLLLGKGVQEKTMKSQISSLINHDDDLSGPEAVQQKIDNGMTVSAIKSWITKEYKEQYIAADTDGRRQLMNELTKMYKLIGVDGEKAMKLVSNWVKEKKTK